MEKQKINEEVARSMIARLHPDHKKEDYTFFVGSVFNGQSEFEGYKVVANNCIGLNNAYLCYKTDAKNIRKYLKSIRRK